MGNGRLQGIIRWLANDPNYAIISHGTEDYYASFFDLITTERPSDGDRVEFSPQLMHGRFKAKFVSFPNEMLPKTLNIRIASQPVHVKYN